MDYINQGASALNHGIDAIVKYGTENGTIRLHDDVVWFVAKNPNFVKATSGGHVLAQGTNAAQNATSREEELRLVRLRQQELGNERAAEAAKLRKEKEDRERKNNLNKKKLPPGVK